MEKIKVILIKIFFNIILITDKDFSILGRLYVFFMSVLSFTPIVFLLETFELWLGNNKQFTTAVILLIFINMVVGSYMHIKNKDFKWRKVILKTISMILIVNITYVVLELVIGRAGSNFIVEGFRATIKVATLLYPASKILKNIFILSKGEHPPKWLMVKVYNFQKNGDLKKFLEKNLEEESKNNENG